jgi:hypothetical protein
MSPDILLFGKIVCSLIQQKEALLFLGETPSLVEEGCIKVLFPQEYSQIQSLLTKYQQENKYPLC